MEIFLAWNKSKGLKIDLCPVSKSTKNINVSVEKFIKTDFQGSDHNILIINFKVDLSSIGLICLGVTSTQKSAIDEFTSGVGALIFAFALVAKAYPQQHIMLSAQVIAIL